MKYVKRGGERHPKKVQEHPPRSMSAKKSGSFFFLEEAAGFLVYFAHGFCLCVRGQKSGGLRTKRTI